MANKIFAVCLFRAHDKVLLKMMFHFSEVWEKTKYFDVRRGENAQQTRSLPCVLNFNSSPIFLLNFNGLLGVGGFI
jgi:hypothetical protein